MNAPSAEPFDVFLSHHSADKAWVRGLRDELTRLGLTAYLDERELPEQDNFVEGLSAEGLRRCRFLVLVVTRRSLERPWVIWEWTNFMALNGPLGRIIPVLLEEAPLPPALAATQALHAAGRPTSEIAGLIARRVGRLKDLPENDLRRLSLGQMLAFDLRRDGDGLSVVGPDGAARPVPSPTADDGFVARLGAFRRLVRTPVAADADRAELVAVATAVGRALFDVLFIGPDDSRLAAAREAGARPLLALCGDDDVLALPWELLNDGREFLVRDGRLDLIRTTRGRADERRLLTAPGGPFTLVVNVSAPVGHGALHYETESYRLTQALTEHCPMTPTELGTLADLVETVKRVQPTGVHFSGHGGPGKLVFEDDDGAPAPASVKELAERLRQDLRERPPSFFYLACCHGNDVTDGAESAAALLHREGVAQVVGYSGPIVDELSTRAEEALYAALADGQTTRQAVREARSALLRPPADVEGRHRDGAAAAGDGGYPFAWSQLVLYHRGPDYPLGTPTTAAQRRQAGQALRRTFDGLGRRRVLKTGFIGRRRELHRVRRHLLKEGKRTLVLQGLGGLGKSTLAFHIPPLLRASKEEVCILWCEGADKSADPVEALVGQLLDYCRKRFGAAWESVVQQVDRSADDSLERFSAFAQVLLANTPRLVLILDNLESLLVGPEETATERPDERAFGAWKSEALQQWWRLLRELAEGGDRLWLIATCRYQNDDFLDASQPVTPLPPDALFRLTEWFETLQQLAVPTRARLAARLDGHPRAVEYAEDLVRAYMTRRRRTHGDWKRPPGADGLEREWEECVVPVLPQVRDKLWANLLLGAIWDNVLDERMRRMLYRMTLLREPWEWGLMAHLGDASEEAAVAEAAAEALCRTSLLETTDTGKTPRFTLHPATAAYVRSHFPEEGALCLETHRRVGDYLEEQAKTSRQELFETDREAGHHLFKVGAYDRAYELVEALFLFLQQYLGGVREGIEILEPYLAHEVQRQMQRPLLCRLLENVGAAYYRIGQQQRAIMYFDQVLSIARDAGDHRGEGAALGYLGSAYNELGHPQRAIEFNQQYLTITRKFCDRQGEANALGNLGSAYAKLGQAQQAIEFSQQVLTIAREIGDRRGEGNALSTLGNAYADLGQAERAEGSYNEAINIFVEIGDRNNETIACWNWGSLFAQLGQLDNAIGFMEFRVRFEQQNGHPDAPKHAARVEQLRQRLAGESPP